MAGALLIVAAALAVGVVLPVVAIIDAARTPAHAWDRAGQRKVAWVVLLVVLWSVGAFVYLVAIRLHLER